MAQTTFSPIPHSGGSRQQFESFDACYLGQGKYLYIHGQENPYDMFATIVTEDGTVLTTQVLEGFHSNTDEHYASYKCIRLNSDHFMVARVTGATVHAWTLGYDSNHVITQKGPAIQMATGGASSSVRSNQLFDIVSIEDGVAAVATVSQHTGNYAYIMMNLYKLSFDGTSTTSTQVIEEEWTHFTGYGGQYRYYCTEIKKCINEDKWVVAYQASSQDANSARDLRGLYSVDFSTNTSTDLIQFNTGNWNISYTNNARIFPVSTSEIYFFFDGNKYATYEGALAGDSLSPAKTWGAGSITGSGYLPVYLESHVAGNDPATTFVFIRNDEYDNAPDDIESSKRFSLFVGSIENGVPMVSPATAAGIQVEFLSNDGYSSPNYGAEPPRMFKKVTESKIFFPLESNSGRFNICLLEF